MWILAWPAIQPPGFDRKLTREREQQRQQTPVPGRRYDQGNRDGIESGNHIMQPVNASVVPLPGVAVLFATDQLLVSAYDRGGASALFHS